MRGYELTFVARPTLDEDGMVALVEKVSGAITALGATVGEVKRWGRRRLAYAIKRYVEGIYVLIRMDIDTGSLPELERTLKLNEDIVRYLIVRQPE